MEFGFYVIFLVAGVLIGGTIVHDSKEEQQAKADRGWIELNGKIYTVTPADVVARKEGK